MQMRQMILTRACESIQDRASAESELKEYQAAISDYTKSIARGCEETMCGAYEYRADIYLRLHDYPHAISDLGHAIRNYLAGTIFGSISTSSAEFIPNMTT